MQGVDIFRTHITSFQNMMIISDLEGGKTVRLMDVQTNKIDYIVTENYYIDFDRAKTLANFIR